MKAEQLAHRFVESTPDQLKFGVLYVSITYDTTVHLCACGCGNHVVLPLHPTAWRLTYDGSAVTMAPSVGNWGFPCRSHYIIDSGRIRWASAWSDDQVAEGRQRTLRDRGVRTGDRDESGTHESPTRWRPVRDLARRVWTVSRPARRALRR